MFLSSLPSLSPFCTSFDPLLYYWFNHLFYGIEARQTCTRFTLCSLCVSAVVIVLYSHVTNSTLVNRYFFLLILSKRGLVGLCFLLYLRVKFAVYSNATVCSFQLFLHSVFGYRGIVLFPWQARLYDRDVASPVTEK